MSPRPGPLLRRWGGRLIRRWGLLPGGEPDGLGEDAQLRGGRLPFRVMVYFGDTLPNLYQLRQWYRPLQALAGEHPVGIVCLDSKVAGALRAECGFPVVCCGRVATLEDLVSRSDVALALYVNHNVRNFHPLRFPTMLHAYLGHGESDKAASASNQVKAYDVVLVAGELGRERLERNLLRYDAAGHVRLIGRPQLDGAAPAGPSTPRDRPLVVYAPTWEGAQPSMAYSSVRTHGLALLRSLVDCGRYEVVYRPHPRLGENSAAYRAADRELRALVTAAGHRVDLGSDWQPATADADVLVTDISAVAGDWLATDRPIVVTRPAAAEAFLDADTVLDVVPVLDAADADRAADAVAAALAGQDADRRRAWVARAMGETAPGAATARFVGTCTDLIADRDALLAARASRGADLTTWGRA